MNLIAHIIKLLITFVTDLKKRPPSLSLFGILKGLFSLIIFLVFIMSINQVQFKLNDIKRNEALTDADPVANAPPVVAFTTIALGSFRGIVANILWLRASMLQEKGQYFEMVQIASWLTKLQPRFTGATAYLAWNMAYNISVTFTSPVDRWRWVKKGLELIRDEAIQYNPADPVLYKELGWIYQHKIGNVMDDANVYYKQQMALEYMKAFGGTQPEWRALIAAPESLEELEKQFPENCEIRKIIEESHYKNFQKLENKFREEGKFPEDFMELVKDKKNLKPIEMCFRKRWLKIIYKLDVAKMDELNKKYGNFDWRLPEAHAIYWATLGLEKSKLSEREVSNDRMITQSLMAAFIGGKLLTIDPKDYMDFMTIPNTNLLDTVIRTFKEAYETHKSQTFRTGAMKNFMTDAVVILYSFGRYSDAQRVLEDMRKEFPEDESLKVDIDDYAMKQWTEDIEYATPNQARSLITSMIVQANYYLAYGEQEAAFSHLNTARQIYYVYRKSRGDTWQRTGLPDFSKLKNDITGACIENFPTLLSKSLVMELENQKNRILELEETKIPEKRNYKSSSF